MAEAIEDGDLNKEYADLEPDAIEALSNGDITENVEVEEEKDDTKEYNARIQKRIGKEVARRKREVSKAEAEANVYRNDAANARRELAEFRAEAVKREKESLEERQKQLQSEMKTALEEGETDAYVSRNDEYLKSTVRLSKLDDEIASSEIIKEQPRQPQVAREASDWYERNLEWIQNDPSKFEQAKKISSELVDSGSYQTTDAELYDEIDRRLSGGNGKPPIVNVPGSNTPTAVSTKGGRLTSSDLQNMKMYGLDPNKVSDRADYRKYKDGDI